jgi:formamidopyrimidine-DNA glycosylase
VRGRTGNPVARGGIHGHRDTTLRRGLAARITGMRITAAEVSDRKISGGLGDAMKQDVAGRQISRVARRGKVLILFLREPASGAGESGSLLIHPKMTGQLVLTSGGVTVLAGGHPTPHCQQR